MVGGGLHYCYSVASWFPPSSPPHAAWCSQISWQPKAQKQNKEARLKLCFFSTVALVGTGGGYCGHLTAALQQVQQDISRDEGPNPLPGLWGLKGDFV